MKKLIVIIAAGVICSVAAQAQNAKTTQPTQSAAPAGGRMTQQTAVKPATGNQTAASSASTAAAGTPAKATTTTKPDVTKMKASNQHNTATKVPAK